MHRWQAAMSDWPFTDPPNLASVSTRGVMERGEPILVVTHEADDGSWQFIGHAWEPDDLVVICLEDAVAMDPSIALLADLPRGWAAERERFGAPWRCYELPPEE